MRGTEKLPMKVLRVAANLTQREAAEQIGVNKNTYSNWERYKTYPDAMQLIKMSKAFECSMDAFYFPTDASSKRANNEKIQRKEIV